MRDAEGLFPVELAALHQQKDVLAALLERNVVKDLFAPLKDLLTVFPKVLDLSERKPPLGPRNAELLSGLLLVHGEGCHELNLRGQNLQTSGSKALAKVLKVNGGLTSVDVRQNNIAGDGAVQLAAAVLGNLKIEMFNEVPIKDVRADSLTELKLNGKGVGVAGGMVVAGLMPVMGALTALDLSFNDLNDEGVSAVCEAIQSNKETKLASLNFRHNGIGPVGANAVAAMVAVTGALTSVELRGNQLGDEGWGSIFAAICGNKNSKIISMDASAENIGLAGVKLIAEALRTSVTGALTNVE
jgi:hypothetical protein